MIEDTWLRRALLTAFLACAASSLAGCSSPTEEAPVASASSSLSIAPLGARERTALAKRSGKRELRLDNGGQTTKAGRVHAAAPAGSGAWAFATIEADGRVSAFQVVERNAHAAANAKGVSTSSVQVLAEESGGGGGACDQQACSTATSAALAAFADFVAASDDEWTALAYGLVWYAREVDKENACRSC